MSGIHGYGDQILLFVIDPKELSIRFDKYFLRLDTAIYPVHRSGMLVRVQILRLVLRLSGRLLHRIKPLTHCLLKSVAIFS